MTKAKKQTEDKTEFGFKRVNRSERQPKVNAVFDSVASRYDVMNDLMSAGMHRLWKADFISQVPMKKGLTHLDVAGGTGDIAFRIYRRALEKDISPKITISDINPNMLGEGKARAIDNGFIDAFSWKEANAEKLPFKDETFDSYTIAFGIRNVTDRLQALKEARRVLKPGGKFLCLEFSHVNVPALKQLYDAYSLNVIPRIGEKVAGDREAYQYLVESIRTFPSVDEFAEMMREAGFARVDYKRFKA